MFEVHLALPKIDDDFQLAKARKMFDLVGLTKTKYFQAVHDINPITPGCLNGHDLSNPGTMSTCKIEHLNQAITLVTKVMSGLRGLGIEGMNFEIEKIITEDMENSPFTSIKGFKSVDNSPAFENHLIWKGAESQIPSHEEIIEWFTGIRMVLNQIVDFSYEAVVEPSTILSRVATFYQPSLEHAVESHDQLIILAPKVETPRVISEQVLIVGEFEK